MARLMMMVTVVAAGVASAAFAAEAPRKRWTLPIASHRLPVRDPIKPAAIEERQVARAESLRRSNDR
jgi:hypothetical protein